MLLDVPTFSTSTLFFFTDVVDGGLEAVAAGCPDLQYLNLFGCTNVCYGRADPNDQDSVGLK